MNIYIITLFPEVFEPILSSSMMRKATENGHVVFDIVDLRNYGIGPRSQVDDTPYGGGAGMVLKPEPVFTAVEEIQKQSPQAKVIMTSPRGKTYTQSTAQALAKLSDMIILCGHYEGFDERISTLVDYEISVGDYILTGGEIPAMTITDSVVRLLPGVLGDERSHQDESFSMGILEYPQYTRPDDFRGMKVPEELKSGDHAKIAAWRKDQALTKTQANRPDLIEF